MSTVLSEVLKDFKLDEDEEKLYILLLTLGDQTEATLSRLVDLPIDDLREVLRKLKGKGLIIELKDGVIRYIPFYPFRLIHSYFSESLRSLNNTGSRIIENKSEIINEINNILSNGKKIFEKNSDEIFETVYNLVDNVSVNFEENRLKLLHLVEEEEKEVDEFKAILAQLKKSLDDFMVYIQEDLKKNLAMYIEDINTTLETVKKGIIDNLDKVLDESLQQLEGLRVESEKSMGAIFETVTASRDAIGSVVESIDQSVLSKMTKVLEFLEINFANEIEKLSTFIAEERLKSEKTFLDLIKEIKNELNSKVINSLSNLKEGFSQSIQDQLSALNEVFSRFEKNAQSYYNLYLEELETIVRTVISDIEDIEINFKEILKNATGEYVESVQNVYNSSVEDLSKVKSKILSNLDTMIENTKNKLRNINLSISKIIDKFYEDLIDTNQNLRGTLLKYIDEVHKNLSTYRAHISNYTKELYKGIAARLEERNTYIKNSLNGLIGETKNSLESIRKEISEKLEDIYDNYLDVFKEIDLIFNKRVLSTTENILKVELERIESSKTEFEKVLNEIEEKIRGKLGEEGGELLEDLGNLRRLFESEHGSRKKFISEVKRILSKEVQSFVRKNQKTQKEIKGKTTEFITSLLNKELENIEKQLLIVSNDISEKISTEASFIISSMSLINTRMEEELDKILDLYKERSNEIRKTVLQTMSGHSEKTFSTINSFKNSVIESIKEDLENLNTITDSIKYDLDEAVDNLLLDYKKTLQLSNEMLSKIESESLSDVLELKRSLETRLKDNINQLKESLKKLLDQRITSIRKVFRDITNNINVIGETSVKSIEEAYNSSVNYLERIPSDFKNKLKEVKEQFLKEYTGDLAEIKDKANKLLQDTKTEIERETTDVLENLKVSLEDNINKIQSGIDKLSLEATKLIDNLKSTTSRFLESLPSSIDTDFAPHIREINEARNRILSDLDKTIVSALQTLEKKLVGIEEEMNKISEILGDEESELNKNLTSIVKKITESKEKLETKKKELESSILNNIEEIKKIINNSVIKSFEEIGDQIVQFGESNRGLLEDILKLSEGLEDLMRERKRDFIETFSRTAIVSDLLIYLEKAKDSVVVALPFIDDRILEALKKAINNAIVEMFIPKEISSNITKSIEGVKIREINKTIPFLAAVVDEKIALLSLDITNENCLGVITWDKKAIDTVKSLITGIIPRSLPKAKARRRSKSSK